MLRCSVPCLLVALTLVGIDVSAQSRCAAAKVSEDVFERRAEFRASVQHAKSIFVGVYHNVISGLIDPPPPDSIDKVEATIKQWPLASKSENGMLWDVRMELLRSGHYRLESDLSKADLILVAKLGRDKNDPIPHGGYWDMPNQFLWDDSLHLFAPGVTPGLIWCGNQAGGLHLAGGSFPLLNKLETDIYVVSQPK